MKGKIIHLVSDISRVNFGVWNVVISVFPFLEEMGYDPEIWFPDIGAEIPDEIRYYKYRIISREVERSLRSEVRSQNLLVNRRDAGSGPESSDLGHRTSDGGSQRSEHIVNRRDAGSGTESSDIGGQKSAVGSQRSEHFVNRRDADSGRESSDIGGQRLAVGSQRSEHIVNRRDADSGPESSDLRHPISDVERWPKGVVVSHGCWGWATKMGFEMQKAGFKWVGVPHGMLEPWSMRQKWLKKQLYFLLVEYPMLKKADAIVAVGRPEFENLRKLFKNVHHIPNGIEPFKGSLIQRFNAPLQAGPSLKMSTGHFLNAPSGSTVQEFKSPQVKPTEGQRIDESMSQRERDAYQQQSDKQINKSTNKLTFLFLGRLHHKKGVVPLIKAWLSSSLNNDSRFQLIVAGPDDGELVKIKRLIGENRPKSEDPFQRRDFVPHQDDRTSDLGPPTSNILLKGPVYGSEKEKLLLSATYFLLPSQSEGFPTSILEAMTLGCIPVFSEGCNFPEALEAGLGVCVGVRVAEIIKTLEE
ncbi:MAG TPA: glycosyltransferase, partial [Cyclobacteriaceae bacterium]|nr:glycosyltransferase [Cyclobacteriaceae bacterium]